MTISGWNCRNMSCQGKLLVNAICYRVTYVEGDGYSRLDCFRWTSLADVVGGSVSLLSCWTLRSLMAVFCGLRFSRWPLLKPIVSFGLLYSYCGPVLIDFVNPKRWEKSTTWILFKILLSHFEWNWSQFFLFIFFFQPIQINFGRKLEFDLL